MHLYDQTNNDTKYLQQVIDEYYPYAKDYMKFDKDADIYLVSDETNAGDFLGKTAYYDPAGFSVYLYIDNRHPKDVVRSLSHELVHHHQNCRGEFDDASNLGEEGYAQNDAHLRNMEKEAYLIGNLAFRDWCDGLKKEDKIQLDLSKTESNKFFYDVIYKPEETHFLKTGKELNCKTENGKKMFVFQASAAFKVWHNIDPDINDKTYELLD